MKIKPNKWLSNVAERLLAYPGIDRKLYLTKLNLLWATMAACAATALITFTMLIFDRNLKILIPYGLAIITVQLIYMTALVLSKRRNVNWESAITFNLYILITFVAIFKLGGIPYSAGLIFIGLATVFFSVPLNSIKITFQVFLLYLTSLIALIILRPYMSVASEVSPALNNFLFGANISWLSVVLFLFIKRFITNNELIEQNEIKKLEEINAVKTSFFTNISHEFRTPITIIQGMAEQIRKNPDEWLEEGLAKIKHSSNDLLALVNEILNISKLETGHMPIHFILADIVKHTNYLVDLFRSMAASKAITIDYKPGCDSFIMDFDPEKINHIITNLLSNALKFTPEGGRITVTVNENTINNKQFIIKVQNNGPEIPPDKLPYIFDRYYRVESGSDGWDAGTGLGLAIAREMVKLFDGSITAESSAEAGTVFTVCLPISRNAPFQDEFHTVPSHKYFIPSFLEKSVTRKVEINTKAPKDAPLLLIIEDNHDVVDYISALLGNEYSISVAYDGQEGFDKASELIPDIILSDVMMPVLSGIEFLKRVKKDIRTSHIPVVMLTAKADLASKLEGLDHQADDYLAKPFNEEELRIRLHNLIELRKGLHKRYSGMKIPASAGDKYMALEDLFMQKVHSLMDTNLQNDHFGITDLSRELGMSRAQLYRKFKSLTNITINEYWLKYRLHRAFDLLNRGDLNVSEAAYEVGFKNLSHFSRTYRAEFGHSPSNEKKIH